MNDKKSGDEPADHAIGRSRGGLTTKNHLVCDGKGRALAFVVTGGQVADSSMLTTTLEQISVAGAAMSWSGASTGSSSSEGSRCARTSTPGTITPGSASPQRSTG